MRWEHNKSYSQVAEDLLVRLLLGRARDVTYIDIGCLWPIQFSNTYLFYSLGGRGLCIDANPELAESYIRERPRDIFVCSGVSNAERKLTYTMFESPVFNTVNSSDSKHDKAQERAGRRVSREIEISTLPLGTILDQAGWWESFDRLDLLSIDVEGHELEVLEGAPLERLAPAVIVCEAEGRPEEVIGSPLVRHLKGRGFRLECVTGHDCFFIPESGTD